MVVDFASARPVTAVALPSESFNTAVSEAWKPCRLGVTSFP